MSKSKQRNPYAKEVREAKYRMRVVISKKQYNRKRLRKIPLTLDIFEFV